MMSLEDFFLQYCFEEEIDTKNLFREYAQDDSRPDFQFSDSNGQQYILEVKIYDQNQHFWQYEKQFENAKFAFIANYEHSPIDNWKIKTWKGFYKALKESDFLNDAFVIGYAEYLKLVINYKEIVKMNFENINTLTSLLECLKDVSGSRDYSEYNNTKSFCESYYGKHFSKGNLYYWFGLYIPDNVIYLGFKTKETSWVPENIAVNLRKQIGHPGSFFDAPKEKEEGNYGDLFFSLKAKFNQKFSDDDVHWEEQKEIIKSFYDEVFDKIESK